MATLRNLSLQVFLSLVVAQKEALKTSTAIDLHYFIHEFGRLPGASKHTVFTNSAACQAHAQYPISEPQNGLLKG
jgi:hypothetical protein